MWNMKVSSTLLVLFRSALASQEWIAGYQPRTLVTDHAAIDLDQREIEKWLSVQMFQPAESVYEMGGYSQSIARIKLVDATPPDEPIPAGTIVYGWNEDGDGVQGKLLEETTWNDGDEDVVLSVLYDIEDESSQPECQVGALVLTDSANHQGCLAGEGEIHLVQLTRSGFNYLYNYVYDIEDDNVNGRTIQGFSTDAFSEMWSCNNCPYDMYSKFVRYYGTTDYGDQWVMAALQGTQTNFDNGNLDFTIETRKSRVEAVKVATKIMNIWMYVIRMLEHAVDQCELPCQTFNLHQDSDRLAHNVSGQCDDSPIRAWDQAMAFYAGSLEGQTGMGEGLLTFDLADKMCKEFKTCGAEGDSNSGISRMNHFVVNEMQDAQVHLMKRECVYARAAKDRIVPAMAIPLVQATLKNAYFRAFHAESTKETRKHEIVAGASFAATILPLVHDCSREDARIIYNNMRLLTEDEEVVDRLDFVAVKEALERNYQCMEISCSDIGGLLQDGEYAPFASPCQDPMVDEKNWSGVVTMGLVLLLAGSVAIVMGIFFYYRQRIKSTIDLTFEDKGQQPSIRHILRESRQLD